MPTYPGSKRCQFKDESLPGDLELANRDGAEELKEKEDAFGVELAPWQANIVCKVGLGESSMWRRPHKGKSM